MTATERLYSQWLHARVAKAKLEFESQIVAICIAACRKAHLTPPFSYEDKIVYRVRAIQRNARRQSLHTSSDAVRSRGIDPNPFWLGRFLSLRPWVERWVSDELTREKPLSDGARYIGRRCVFALIDEIRRDQRRRGGAQIRARKQDDDPEEIRYMRSGMREVLGQAGLPAKLNIEKDRKLFRRLMAAYPGKVRNVLVAREWGVSEGAIRKRRKRIARICYPLAEGSYQLRTVLNALGLGEW
jgi:hypothetical protein